MKCILAAGIESISGTMKGKDGKNLTFRTYNRLQPDGTYKKETRVYLQPQTQRSTPVTDAEIKQRNLFALASEFWRTMPTETKQIYNDIWKRDGYRFNGKVYVTLRGYVIARFMAEHKSN